jgi:hypothetical protein
MAGCRPLMDGLLLLHGRCKSFLHVRCQMKSREKRVRALQVCPRGPQARAP